MRAMGPFPVEAESGATKFDVLVPQTRSAVVCAYPTAKVIHCVVDNLSTHSVSALGKCFGEEESPGVWHKSTGQLIWRSRVKIGPTCC